jgi:hypothetical protein
MFPFLIKDGVISTHTDICLACGAPADMWNVLGAFCQTHKPNYVREFRTKEDLKHLDVTQDPALREHLKEYVSEVWKL